jgi:hypothetical protein
MIGATFGDEVMANPILRNRRHGVNWNDDTAWLAGDDATPEEIAALAAVLAAHDPNKVPVRTKVIADIFESLTATEVNTLAGIAAFRKHLWTMLARGEQSVREDHPKVVALCTALGITPQALFDR